MSTDLSAFVVPDAGIAAIQGIDLQAAGFRVVVSPRHASILIVLDTLPTDLLQAASVTYAQMPRPRWVMAIGTAATDPLPPADITVELDQSAVADGAARLRVLMRSGAFSPQVTDYIADTLVTHTRYTCPMHPEIVADEPGNCPICGMNLVALEKSSGADVVVEPVHHGHHDLDVEEVPHSAAEHQASERQYTCPMHLEIIADEPGHCPICGMDLVPQESLTDGEALADGGDADPYRNLRYTCPMHPEVLADAPGSCPICGMNLVPLDTADTDRDAHGRGGGDTHINSREHEVPADDRDAAQIAHMYHAGHAMRAHEHEMGGTGNVDGAGHERHGGMDGFMSMVAMTRDLPRSPDGLPMEWVEASFGPLFPGLPGGLNLSLTLDGDAVADIRVDALRLDPGDLLDPSCPVGDFPERLARVDRLAPDAYRALAWRALIASGAAALDEDWRRRNVALLEHQRVISHLVWLGRLGTLLGLAWLEASATSLALRLVRQRRDGRVGIPLADVDDLVSRVRRTPLLHRRLAGTGCIASEDGDQTTGPNLRAGGPRKDARIDDPLMAALGFEPILAESSDASGRLEVRLSEIVQSARIVKRLDCDSLSAPRITGHGLVQAMGTATIETPRGQASIEISIEDGCVSRVVLESPATRNLMLVRPAALGHEVGDALIAVASLDLSPWEMRS